MTIADPLDRVDGASAAIDWVAARFGLSRIERDALLLCLRPELDTVPGELPAWATPRSLINSVAERGEDEALARGAFGAEGVLRRLRLVHVEDLSLPFELRPLRVDERIIELLVSPAPVGPPRVPALTALPARPSTGAMRDAARRLALALTAEHHVAAPAIVLAGPDGSGVHAMAAVIGDLLGRDVWEIDLEAIPHIDPAVAARESILTDACYFVDVRDAEPHHAREVLRFVDSLPGPVLVGASRPPTLQRPSLSYRLPDMDESCRTEVWVDGLGAVDCDFDRTALARQLAAVFRIGPSGIGDAVAAASRRALDEARPVAESDVSWAARVTAESQGPSTYPTFVRNYAARAHWCDLVLPADSRRQLEDLTQQLRYRAVVDGEWAMHRASARGRAITALFTGPSGTGKTLAAEVLANELGLELLAVDLSLVVDKYIGETEKRLATAFDVAERRGGLLFFDEADALFGKRSDVRDAHDRYANIEVDFLLQRLEAFSGLAILATNQRGHLDPAFMRRIRFSIDFPFPDAVARAEIWRRMLAPPVPTEALDIDALARLEVAGGNIQSIALNAAFLGAAEGGMVTMDHLWRAARREYAKIDRLVQVGEFGDGESVAS